jgi:CheY-like chemotaxis protein
MRGTVSSGSVGSGRTLRQALLTILGHAAGEIDPGLLVVHAVVEPGRIAVTISGPDRPDLGPARLGLLESGPFVEVLDGTVMHRPSDRVDGRWSIELGFPAEEPPLLLVVNNNDDFRRPVERFMVGQGWAVLGAASVDEAYALACRYRTVAILLDVVIPGRDGWELLLELKQLPSTREIPVIVCSVLDEPAVAIALGAAYLQKPIDQERLLAALAPLLKPSEAGPLAIA